MAHAGRYNSSNRVTGEQQGRGLKGNSNQNMGSQIISDGNYTHTQTQSGLIIPKGTNNK